MTKAKFWLSKLLSGLVLQPTNTKCMIMAAGSPKTRTTLPGNTRSGAQQARSCRGKPASYGQASPATICGAPQSLRGHFLHFAPFSDSPAPLPWQSPQAKLTDVEEWTQQRNQSEQARRKSTLWCVACYSETMTPLAAALLAIQFKAFIAQTIRLEFSRCTRMHVYLCVCIYMYVCMYVCMCVCIIYIYIYIYIYI